MVGRSFALVFLAALLQQEPQAVAEPLQALVEAEILLPRRYGAEIQYEFRHALLQRIAYESMLQPERQCDPPRCGRHAAQESSGRSRPRRR